MNQLVPITAPRVPELVAATGERAGMRFLEFFAANIRNPHTRRAYARAADEFLAWCSSAGVPSIGAVQPVHVATWIEAGTRELAAPSVKQRLAAIRHLFDWLVTGQVVPVNPAASVRGPRHVVTSGQTPVLDPSEARALLDSIDTSTVVGLRDRALIGLMVYSFARIGAALGMSVEDVFTQNRRLWVRLHEKGGKRHAMPCHHNLEEYLTAYLDGASLRGDPKGPLFRTGDMVRRHRPDCAYKFRRSQSGDPFLEKHGDDGRVSLRRGVRRRRLESRRTVVAPRSLAPLIQISQHFQPRQLPRAHQPNRRESEPPY
jgi:integrase/recombinase XerC